MISDAHHKYARTQHHVSSHLPPQCIIALMQANVIDVGKTPSCRMAITPHNIATYICSVIIKYRISYDGCILAAEFIDKIKLSIHV